MINVLIVHYNTPELTEACVKSINKHTPGCKIFIFDNSDKRPFTAYFDNVEIIDNTKGQIIDFDKWLEQFPDKYDNDYGSAKHCKSIDLCFDLLPQGFILLDADVLIKKDIKEFWNEKNIYVGQPHVTKKHLVNIPRLYPFLCYINVPMCKENNIKYFNENFMWKLSKKIPNAYFDTGAYFLQSVSNFPKQNIKLKDFIVHHGRSSLVNNQLKEWSEWLNKYEKLWN